MISKFLFFIFPMKQCPIVGQSREPIIGHLHLLSATHFNILKTLSNDSGMSSGWKKYDSNTLVYDLWIYQLHFSWTACILLAIFAAYIHGLLYTRPDLLLVEFWFRHFQSLSKLTVVKILRSYQITSFGKVWFEISKKWGKYGEIPIYL